MTRRAALLLLLALQGCAVVNVYSNDPNRDVKVGLWPLGVRIEAQPGAKDGVTVNAKSVGFSSGCGAIALGLSSFDCTMIDAKTCGLAIIVDPASADAELLGKVADQSRAHCAQRKGSKP